MKTAFVFTGGGSLGAIQAGMLKAVSAAGIVPDFLVGASVGAINAAFFASDPTRKGALRLEKSGKESSEATFSRLDPLVHCSAFSPFGNIFVHPNRLPG